MSDINKDNTPVEISREKWLQYHVTADGLAHAIDDKPFDNNAPFREVDIINVMAHAIVEIEQLRQIIAVVAPPEGGPVVALPVSSLIQLQENSWALRRELDKNSGEWGSAPNLLAAVSNVVSENAGRKESNTDKRAAEALLRLVRVLNAYGTPDE